MGYSLNIIKAIKGETKPPFSILSLIDQTRTMLKSLDNFSIDHIFREANSLADEVANLAVGGRTQEIWKSNFPEPFWLLAQSDCQRARGKFP